MPELHGVCGSLWMGAPAPPSTCRLWVICVASLPSAASAAASNPLDPLSADEIQRTVTTIEKAKNLAPATFFNVVKLSEPPKSFMQSSGPAVPAEVVRERLRPQRDKLYDAVVDLCERECVPDALDLVAIHAAFRREAAQQSDQTVISARSQIGGGGDSLRRGWAVRVTVSSSADM